MRLAVGFEEMRPGALALELDRPASGRWPELARGLIGRIRRRAIRRRRGRPSLFGGAGTEYAAKTRDGRRELSRRSPAKARVHAAEIRSRIFRNAAFGRGNDRLAAEHARPDDPLSSAARRPAVPPRQSSVRERLRAQRARRAGPRSQAQAMTIGSAGDVRDDERDHVVGYGIVRAASRQAYEKAGVGPEGFRWSNSTIALPPTSC